MDVRDKHSALRKVNVHILCKSMGRTIQQIQQFSPA